jgi:adenylate cyclase
MTDSGQSTARRRGVFPRPFLLSAVFALLATLLLAEIVPRFAPGLLRFDHMMGDLRTASLSDRLASQHPKVAIVSITDATLKDNKVRQPVDRALLARIVEAVDAAGATAIGLDFLFVQATPPDNEDVLIEAIRRAKAKVVLAAADERVELGKAQMDRQAQFVAKAGRPAGYANLATERDWIIRFRAGPGSEKAYPRSFSALLAESSGVTANESYRRIAWLLEPHDGSDTFLTIPAETLLQAPSEKGGQLARAGLQGKIVLIGGTFPDIDRHLTPLSVSMGELQPGVLIHAHMVAELVDKRHIGQIETDSLAMKLELMALAGFAFLVGWRTRKRGQGLLLGTVATVAIIAVDTFVFWYWRIILPVVLALVAWFLGEFAGNHIGRWLGSRTDKSKGLIR